MQPTVFYVYLINVYLHEQVNGTLPKLTRHLHGAAHAQNGGTSHNSSQCRGGINMVGWHGIVQTPKNV